MIARRNMSLTRGVLHGHRSLAGNVCISWHATSNTWCSVLDRQRFPHLFSDGSEKKCGSLRIFAVSFQWVAQLQLFDHLQGNTWLTWSSISSLYRFTTNTRVEALRLGFGIILCSFFLYGVRHTCMFGAPELLLQRSINTSASTPLCRAAALSRWASTLQSSVS